MAPGRCDLEGPLGQGLAADVREAGGRRAVFRSSRAFGCVRQGRGQRLGQGQALHIEEVGDDLAQIGGGPHHEARGMLGARRATRRHDGLAHSRQAQGQKRREAAPGRPQTPVQRQLAEEGSTRQGLRRELTRCRQDRDGDREVEARPVLPELRRREVHRDPPVGERQARGRDRASDPRNALPDRRLGQPDYVDAGQLGGDPNFDFDGHARHTNDRRTPDTRHPSTRRGRVVSGWYRVQVGVIRSGRSSRSKGRVTTSNTTANTNSDASRNEGRQSSQGRTLPPTFEKPREERAYI